MKALEAKYEGIIASAKQAKPEDKKTEIEAKPGDKSTGLLA